MDEIISIIIPIYKVELYLRRCIDSVLKQTYENLEIILIDDGSPDRCGEICDEYANLDHRIKAIHKKNGGLSDSRNVGIDICKGDYISFLDSDDFIHEKYIERLYELLLKTNADISICNFIKTTTEYIETDILKEEVHEYSNLEALEQFTGKFFLQMIIACGKLYKRELFKEIRFPVGRLREDEFTTYKLIFKSKKVTLTTTQMYYYWQREDSIMGQEFNLRSMLDAIDAIEERGNFFGRIGKTELMNKTYANLFYMYKEVNDRKGLFEKKEHFKRFREKYNNFKKAIRKTNQGSKFRLYYKTYFIAPKITNNLVRIYSGRKRISKKVKPIVLPIIREVQNKLFRCRLGINSYNKRKLYGNCIYLMATPCHGNLGDHAIVYSEYKYLKDFDLDKKIIEIKNSDYHKYKNIIKKIISNEDIIVIDGGGNLGTLWPNEDDKISEIIKNYIHNKIIIFPQTCFFSVDSEGRERLRKSKRVYKRHRDLTIALRDKVSYDFVCRNFPSVKSIYMPDIVLYMDSLSQNIDRSGVLLCFRKDLEKVVSIEEVDNIKEYLKINNLSYIETDTIINKNITKSKRKRELKKKWQEFSRAGLVITDRLHGMIFATITGTPCIAVDNKSKKVSGVYSWISSLSYIKVCKDITEVQEKILDLYNYKSEYDKKELKYSFNKISKELRVGYKNEEI